MKRERCLHPDAGTDIPKVMRLFCLLLPAFLIPSLTARGDAPAADPQALAEKALAAAGGKEKVLKIFRVEELYHFGDTPDPAEGKKRSTRVSVIQQPDKWWIGRAERGEEAAKDDVRAWSLDLLVDPASVLGAIPDLVDEGVACAGLEVSGSVTPPMKLYFDKETHRLKRLDWRSDFYRFSEWREQDGLHYAARTIIYQIKSGKPWFFHEITGLERLATLPEGLGEP